MRRDELSRLFTEVAQSGPRWRCTPGVQVDEWADIVVNRRQGSPATIKFLYASGAARS